MIYFISNVNALLVLFVKLIRKKVKKHSKIKKTVKLKQSSSNLNDHNEQYI